MIWFQSKEWMQLLKLFSNLNTSKRRGKFRSIDLVMESLLSSTKQKTTTVSQSPVKNRWFFTPDIIGGDVPRLSSGVLNPPPMFGIVEKQKSFVAFHVQLLVPLSDVIVFGHHILGLVRRRWPHGQSVLGFKLIFDRQISLNTTTDVPSFSVKKCNQKMMRFLIGFFVQHYVFRLNFA